MSEVILTRKTLYDLVWSEPMLKLSKKYVISDVGLRKICISMDIPLPRAGHWMKLQAGKKVPKQKLPENYTGKTEVKLELREDGKVYNTGIYSESKKVQNEIKTSFENDLKVPERLTSRDPLIVAAKQSLAQKNKSYRFEGLIETGRGILDIQVSVLNVSRALRFMDCLLKMLRLRGHDIEVNSQGTHAIVDGEKIKMICREKCTRVISTKYSWSSYEFHANGLLSFKTDGYHGGEWVDGSKLIEEQIPAIIAKMEISVKDLRIIQEENRVRMQAYEEERLKEKATEERKAKELRDFKTLLNEAHRWHDSQILRTYLDAVEQNVALNNSKREEFDQWLTWAKRKADWYDPILEASDELLTNIDKAALEEKLAW